MTYLVEGIQGSGKSTLVKFLSEKCHDHEVLEEGDYSPIELAWWFYRKYIVICVTGYCSILYVK